MPNAYASFAFVIVVSASTVLVSMIIEPFDAAESKENLSLYTTSDTILGFGSDNTIIFAFNAISLGDE